MKKFKHNKIEICKISKRSINTDKERYAIILDCNGKLIESIGFYKQDLLRDLVSGSGQMVAKNVMGNVLNMAEGMLQQVGITKPVYDLK